MTKHFTRAAAATAALVIAGGVATVSFASDATEAKAPKAAAATGELAIIQAVPQTTMSVTVDGKDVKNSVSEGQILPLDLAPGSHEVVFNDGKGSWTSSLDVTAGASSDVVVHRPAEVGGNPVISVYPTPADPIGAGKARVLLAHTATTAPADVVVDGQTVFTNIANGEFAQTDLASGDHEVSLLPAGVKGSPILGPLDLDLKAGTVTNVYAVGNPKDGSMNVIVRTVGGTMSTTKAPSGIDTGEAGMVGNVKVWTFNGR